MLRKITAGVGLVEFETYAVGPDMTYEDRQVLLSEMEEMIGPASRERTAIEFRQVLKNADIEEPGSHKDPDQAWFWINRICALPEDSLERLAVSWLVEFSSLKRCQDCLAKDGYTENAVHELIHHAEELGRLKNMIFWRCEPDPKTGVRREALALTGQKMRLTGKANRETKLSRSKSTRQARFRIMRERVPVVGVDRAAAETSVAGHGTISAIKKQWNKAVAAGEVPRLGKEKGTQR